MMIKYVGFVLVALGFVFGGAPANVLAAEIGSHRIISAALKAEELNGRYESDINYWTTQPSGKELLKLEEAFNKRFKLKVKLKQTPVRTPEVASRFLVAAQAGRPAEGDITVISPPALSALGKNGLLEEFDWIGVLGREFPEIQRRVNIIPPEFRNKTLELYHLLYIIAYRTDRLKREELPKTWEELANPKWAGRFAAANRGYPFNYFLSVPGWNEQKVLNLAKAIRDNRAVFVPSSAGAVAALQSGEVSLGITTVGQLEELKAKGTPVDWVALPGLVLAQKSVTIPKGAPHVNLARLFGAWLTTEGRGLYESLTMDGLAWPEENSRLANKLKQLGLRNTDLTLIDTAEKDELAEKMLEKIQGINFGR